jgi:MoxR-like ATPase
MYLIEVISFLGDLRLRVLHEVSKVVIGREVEVNMLLVGLLARGHVLIEGVPGTSKTLVAKSFSKCLGLAFRRVQFTPDMLPLDVIGGFVLNMKTRELEFRRGPVFTNILLGDEINRAPPKVQSALLEAMQELQVTVEGYTEKLPSPFMVIATQNSVESEGVYNLPEAELDRFMIKITFGYQDPKVESNIIRRNLSELSLDDVKRVVETEELNEVFRLVDSVKVSSEILDYITRLGLETRQDSQVELGASPRALVHLAHCARAYSALQKRNYVTPDDVKAMAPYVLPHRIILKRSAVLKSQAIGPDIIVARALDKVRPPR